MGYIKRNGKIVGYEATPDDSPIEVDCADQDIVEIDPDKKPDPEIADDQEQNSQLFTAEDRLIYPRRGHIPGSVFSGDGKIVTNSGLRQTGWSPADD